MGVVAKGAYVRAGVPRVLSLPRCRRGGRRRRVRRARAGLAAGAKLQSCRNDCSASRPGARVPREAASRRGASTRELNSRAPTSLITFALIFSPPFSLSFFFLRGILSGQERKSGPMKIGGVERGRADALTFQAAA